jgi:hypothetical protein
VGSPAQGAVSGSFQTMRSTSGPVTHNESLIPLTPAGYLYRVLASLPKSRIDRLTPRLLQLSSSRESTEVPEGDKTASAEVGCKYAVGTLAMGLATIAEYSNSLREVPL